MRRLDVKIRFQFSESEFLFLRYVIFNGQFGAICRTCVAAVYFYVVGNTVVVIGIFEAQTYLRDSRIFGGGVDI